jgi:hypothetical protein
MGDVITVDDGVVLNNDSISPDLRLLDPALSGAPWNCE